LPPLFPSPIGLYKGSAALKPHYQNLPQGFFLSEVLIQKLIEVSRERLASDPYALARFEANIRRVDVLLSFEVEDEDEVSGDMRQKEQVKAVYTQDEFFDRFTEIYGLQLAESEKNMYWNMLQLRRRLWFSE
jgi:hypothetical protein